MKTKISSKVRSFSSLPLLAVWGLFSHIACTAEFETECPEGMVQNGGGDVDVACIPADAAGAAGAAGGGGGESGSEAGQSGQGAGSGGQTAVCAEGSTRCLNDTQETCGADGQWGAAKGCDIKCDASGSTCVVPVQLAVNGEFSCALLSDGTARCWGSNESGQLGLGMTDVSQSVLKPAIVVGIGGIKKIVAKGANVCAMTQDGGVWCWGDNRFEQIAAKSSGPGAFFAAPLLLSEREVSEIGLGLGHLCVLKQGTILCRGANESKQLGNASAGETSGQFVEAQSLPSRPVEVAGGGSSTCSVTESGDVYCWGQMAASFGNTEDKSRPTKVPGNAAGAKKLYLSHFQACVLRDRGLAACWGDNYYGQLGRGTAGVLGDTDAGNTAELVNGLSDVVDLFPGGNHFFAAKSDRRIWGWGQNNWGELGNDCSVSPCERNEVYFSPLPMEGPAFSIKTAAGGGAHTCAVDDDNVVYCWGYNSKGQLGNGEVKAGATPTPTRVLWK